MPHGHEERFFDLDLDAIRRRLRGLSATCVVPRHAVRGVVLENDRTRSSGSLLSLRSEGDEHVLGLTREGAPDLRVPVADPAALQEILKELGLTATRHQSSHREEWRLRELTCVLDEWPGLPPCLEIGGPDRDSVRWAARQLGVEVTTDAQAYAGSAGGTAGTAADGPAALTVADVGWSCSQNGWTPGVYRIDWAAVLENPNRCHYCPLPKLQVTARAENGMVVGSSDQALTVFPPGARLAWASWLETTEPPHTVEVTPRRPEFLPTAARPEDFPPFGYRDVRFTVRGRACSVTGRIVNPYGGAIAMLAITALFRDARGRLLSGETAFVDALAGLGTAPFKLDGEAPAAAGAVTSLDLVAMPWSAGPDGPWEQVLSRG